MTTDKIKARHLDEDFKLPLDKLEEMPTAESIGASPVGHTHTAEEIGLGSVDNTADANKPVSTAQATAIADAKKAGTDAQSTADGIRTDLTKLEGTVSGHVGNDDIHFTATERSKLAGIATGANKYSHPTYTAKNSGLYKVTVDGTGHVSSATVATKSDITGLGIPAQDTTYSDATTSSSGLMSSSDKSKLDGIATGANKTTVDSSLSSTSTNPVQNKVINSALAGKLSTSLKGAANGLAELDANGKVPASQLPSYVDDVIEGTYVSATSFKDASGTAITGESGKIYVDTTSGKTYRWSGSAFSVISETLALGETSSTAYRGDRGKTAYDHSQATGNPHGTSKSDLGLGNVENKSSATIRSELTKSNVTTALGYTPPTQDTTYGEATTSASGLMSASDKSKLNGIAEGANKYTHPTHTAKSSGFYKVTVDSSGHVSGTTAVTKSDITGLGIPAQDTTYSAMKGASSSATGSAGLVPAPAAGKQASFLRGDGTWVVPTNTTYDVATQSVNGLMSSTDKTKLDGIATGANKYTHPTTSGNKHIPSGGSSGQILRWSADGTAVWGADNNTTYGVVSTTADGLAPKRDGSTTKFLRGDGTWAVPPDTNTTYSEATTSASGLMSATDKSKLNGIAEGANKYSLPTASSSTLGGVKIGSNIKISSGKISVPTADGSTAGVTIVYPAASCTTFSSDSGTVTPLAVQKGAKMFSITRPTSSTNKAITRYSNTTGDVQDSKIIIEDVTNTRDTSQKAQVISVPAANGAKKMVYGYCTDQVDGTSFIGGLFDADATEFPYAQGLAIGGSSGNLLWKGAKVATASDLDGLTTEMAEVKKSVSDGKTKVANAITGKGVTTATDATFATMATNIGSITTLSSGTSDATINATDVLSGKIGYGKNGAKITGTMTNNGAVSQTLAANGSYTIPAGYHNGSGKVTQNLTTKGATTYTPSTSNQTIAAGTYCSGAQTIKGDSNLLAGNIVSGKSIFGVAGSATPVTFNSSYVGTLYKKDSPTTALNVTRYLTIDGDDPSKFPTTAWTYPVSGSNMRSVAVDTSGNSYFGSNVGPIYKVNSSGTLVWTYTGLGSSDRANWLVWGSDGYLYASKYQSYPGVHKIKSNGTKVWGYNATNFDRIFYIALDSSNNSYLSGGWTHGYVEKVTSSGNLSWRVALNNRLNYAIGTYKSEYVYIGGSLGEGGLDGSKGAKLYKLKCSDGSTVWSVDQQSDNMYGMSLDSAGNIYTYAHGGSTFKKWSPSGTLLNNITLPDGAGGYAIHVDNLDYIYVGTVKGNMYKYTPNLELVWSMSNVGSTSTISAITTDSSGTIYVSSNLGHMGLKINNTRGKMKVAAYV